MSCDMHLRDSFEDRQAERQHAKNTLTPFLYLLGAARSHAEDAAIEGLCEAVNENDLVVLAPESISRIKAARNWIKATFGTTDPLAVQNQIENMDPAEWRDGLEAFGGFVTDWRSMVDSIWNRESHLNCVPGLDPEDKG